MLFFIEFFPALISGEKYDAVLFDVDSKDTSLGMSCPPKEFLEINTLKNVRNLLHQNGLFILNLVLRNKSLRPKILKDLESNFRLVKNFEIEEDLNEIFVSTVNNVKHDLFKKEFDDSLAVIETFINKQNK